jgi:hypothetical protein
VLRWPLTSNVSYDGFVLRWPVRLTSHMMVLIDGLKSWDIICEIWWFCTSITLECEIWDMVVFFSLNNPWMQTIIYGGFLPWWLWIIPRRPLNAKYDVRSFVLWWPLNVKYDIWWYCALMTLDYEIWYWVYMTLNSINYKDDIVPH